MACNIALYDIRMFSFSLPGSAVFLVIISQTSRFSKNRNLYFTRKRVLILPESFIWNFIKAR